MSRIIVTYGGGFQPFHQGHMSSYVQAKKTFPGADFFVVASNDTKTRPIPFDSKRFLALEAGVKDPFIQVKAPINPTEILKEYDPQQDIFIMVRSERDPVGYTKKDGSPGYFQPFVSLDKCEPFTKHGYVFVTKKHTFSIGGVDIYSGSQVRSLYARTNDAGKKELIKGLYPKSNNQQRIKAVFDKYLSIIESIKYAQDKVLKEGTLEQKLRMQMIVHDLAEGMFDRFKKKMAPKPTRMDITPEQRAFISKYFPANNAGVKFGGPDSRYVLPDSVRAEFGLGILHFLNMDGNLSVSVAYHRSKEDRMNPRASPLTHFDADINSDADMITLKNKISGVQDREVTEGWFSNNLRQGAEPSRPLSGGAGYAGLSRVSRLYKDASDASKMARSLQKTNSDGRYDNDIKKFLQQAQEYKAQAEAIEKQGVAEGWKSKVAGGVAAAGLIGMGAAGYQTNKATAGKYAEPTTSQRQTVKPLNFSNNPYSNDTVPDLNDPTNNRSKLKDIDEETTTTEPVKPFSQVKQYPLDALLTGQGNGAELKATASYNRDNRRNKQVADQRAKNTSRVKAGYSGDTDEGDWAAVNERLKEAAKASGLRLGR